jgi:hypothetical protein
MPEQNDINNNTIQLLDEELRRTRNELAMTKQDLIKAQVAVRTAINFLHAIGGNLVKVSLSQSEAQGMNAETIKGIEKVLMTIQSVSPQQQQQQQQEPQPSQQQQQPPP